MNARRPEAEILLVEDDRATAWLVQEALKGSAAALHVSLAQDGELALAMLRRQGAYAETPRPDLILLDLNLPKKDGFAVLGEVKEDPALKHIPIAVLTTSQAPADIQRGYDQGANCYIVKPRDLQQIMTVIRLTADFWLTVVTLPRS
jgi:two-component system, chemotaxis family, response regulator Rcp1